MDVTAAKTFARAYWQALDSGDDLSPFLAPDAIWEGPHPVPMARGAAEVAERWQVPFRAALPQVDRQFHILMAGTSSGRQDGTPDPRMWVGATGYLLGQAAAPFHGIPAGDRPLRLRWGECLCIENGRITETQMLIDVMDWCEQVDARLLPPSRGVPGVYPAPTAFDGTACDGTQAETVQTLQLGRDLIFGGLNTYDESDLTSMGMARFFHPNLKWYGPGGIGACLSLSEFEVLHQQPWLDSFPNRKVQDLQSLFAEGRMLAGSGSAGVKANHTGAPYQGSGPGRGQEVQFSGLDFWLRTGDVFTENWVFVDFVKLFGDLGIDLLDRMAHR